jgi:hypothetical protein
LKLFLIRNMYTAIMANSILEHAGEEVYGIALLVELGNLDSLNDYQDQLEHILRLSNKWNQIIRLNSRIKYPTKWNKFSLIKAYKKRIIDRLDFFEQIFKDSQVSEVLISFIGDVLNENSLIFVARNNAIRFSLYDETLYQGYLSAIFNSNVNFKKNYTARLVKTIKSKIFLAYLRKYRQVIDINIFNHNLELRCYYSMFPELYPFENVKQKFMIIPRFMTFQIQAKSVLLTSSYSEDGILSLEEEIDLIKKITSVLPKETYIRFHPRDSISKKNHILEMTGYKLLDIELEASEYIVNSSELQELSGYICSTLFVATRLRPDLKINSFIGLLSDEIINRELLKKISLDFPNINFQGL